jgi:Na+-driven multidrug efflux pump
MTLLCVFVGAKYGILGVAVGMLISRLFDCTIKLAYLAHKLSINFVTILKSVLTPSWVELSLALICYLIAYNLPYGTYIGVFVFALSSFILFVYAPKVFGEVVYENVYLVAKGKIETVLGWKVLK